MVFNEITKKAIQEAFEKPGDLDMKHVRSPAGQALPGPCGWFHGVAPVMGKVARALPLDASIRCRANPRGKRAEIHAFIPEEYWELYANLTTPGMADDEEPLRFQVLKADGNEFKPTNEDDTRAAMALLEPAEYKVMSERTNLLHQNLVPLL